MSTGSNGAVSPQALATGNAQAAAAAVDKGVEGESGWRSLLEAKRCTATVPSMAVLCNVRLDQTGGDYTSEKGLPPPTHPRPPPHRHTHIRACTPPVLHPPPPPLCCRHHPDHRPDLCHCHQPVTDRHLGGSGSCSSLSLLRRSLGERVGRGRTLAAACLAEVPLGRLLRHCTGRPHLLEDRWLSRPTSRYEAFAPVLTLFLLSPLRGTRAVCRAAHVRVGRLPNLTGAYFP